MRAATHAPFKHVIGCKCIRFLVAVCSRVLLSFKGVHGAKLKRVDKLIKKQQGNVAMHRDVSEIYTRKPRRELGRLRPFHSPMATRGAVAHSGCAATATDSMVQCPQLLLLAGGYARGGSYLAKGYTELHARKMHEHTYKFYGYRCGCC